MDYIEPWFKKYRNHGSYNLMHICNYGYIQ